jgi:hypothetical protein
MFTFEAISPFPWKGLIRLIANSYCMKALLRPITISSLSAALLLFLVPSAQADTVRLFLIGNSFSGNASRYLPQLAKDGKHTLVIGRAEVGGCSLERHWNAYAAAEKDPDSAEGKFYNGRTLRQLLGKGEWDVVTLQQYSLLSPDSDTYKPFARQLRDAVKQMQPDAEVVLHQTWAYRTDAKNFGFINQKENQRARNQRQMWGSARQAYRSVAADLGVGVIPSGDAFWRVDSDPQWGYKPDTTFDFKNAAYPALPDQNHSLHVGYNWNKEKTSLGADYNHANAAGCYLAGLVWYGFLFKESPEKLTFAPKEVPAEFAAYLRRVAWQIVQENRG